jgi:hypothetical protein
VWLTLGVVYKYYFAMETNYNMQGYLSEAIMLALINNGKAMAMVRLEKA